MQSPLTGVFYIPYAKLMLFVLIIFLLLFSVSMETWNTNESFFGSCYYKLLLGNKVACAFNAFEFSSLEKGKLLKRERKRAISTFK